MTIAEPRQGAADAQALDFEFELNATLDKVWRALTEPQLVAGWLAPDAIGADLGGPVDCRVLEAEPERFIRYAWRGDGEAGPLETEVLFELAQTGAKVRLRLTHSGFLPAAVAAASPRVVSLAAHRARRRPMAGLAGLGGLKWAA
jgi:uncharacterized protein YndB with AHSA1/START domain